LHETRKYGGRAALFGRKINQAECQLAFIEFLRHIADGVIKPDEAVEPSLKRRADEWPS
jgi:hypothetical protein